MSFSNIPTELVLQIAGYSNKPVLSFFSRLNREWHWRFFYLMMDATIEKRIDPGMPQRCLQSLFFHAVKLDSTIIVQYLRSSTDWIDLNGYIFFSPTASNLDR
jgi:hypothetical protein